MHASVRYGPARRRASPLINLQQAGSVALVLGLLLVGSSSCSPFIDKLGGDFAGPPEALQGHLTPKARELIAAAFKDVDPARLIDFHTHMLGLGTGDSGAYVNPELRSIWHPFKSFRFAVYRSASGVTDPDKADRQYVSRLAALIRGIPGHGRHVIMAFDKHYRADGSVDDARTPFHVPNAYVYGLAERHPELFVPMISVHPYRRDAVQALERWAAKGVRFVKWLPNVMGMDPSDPAIDPYYETMKRLGMVLLTHTGREHALASVEFQRYGNPLLYRRPLNMGVTIIMAHCASLGTDADLDQPHQPEVPSFELFIRMMDERRYEGLLYGEISGATQYNRYDGPLQTLLQRQDLHHRLVNGSDYPLPAVNALVRTSDLEEAGFISAEERDALNLIYRYNPLLFDFILKRTVRHPASGARFLPAAFESPDQLLPAARRSY